MKMEAIQPEIAKYIDIFVTNRDGNIVLLFEVKANKVPLNSSNSQINSCLRKIKNVRFVMLANLEEIHVFQVKNNKLFDNDICLMTSDILSYYDDEFNQKRIFQFYLVTLLEAWLRDLAYHWKSEKPPAAKKLEKIGLLQEIEGGDTYAHNKYEL
ncbi:MAG TPA: type I restriction enzyme HsdR N-terminal domain-containing protein [Leptolyngbyaceae cyanobacterium]